MKKKKVPTNKNHNINYKEINLIEETKASFFAGKKY